MKSAISQRWEDEFQKLVRESAGKMSMSMTQLTVEALSVYLKLSKENQFVSMKSEERKKFIEKTVLDVLLQIGPKSLEGINLVGLEGIGLIRERVSKLLKNNPDRKFSTNEISEILSIPQSTSRAYVRDLNNDNPKTYVLLAGRPNQVYFRKTIH